MKFINFFKYKSSMFAFKETEKSNLKNSKHNKINCT